MGKENCATCTGKQGSFASSEEEFFVHFASSSDIKELEYYLRENGGAIYFKQNGCTKRCVIIEGVVAGQHRKLGYREEIKGKLSGGRVITTVGTWELAIN